MDRVDARVVRLYVCWLAASTVAMETLGLAAYLAIDLGEFNNLSTA